MNDGASVPTEWKVSLPLEMQGRAYALFAEVVQAFNRGEPLSEATAHRCASWMGEVAGLSPEPDGRLEALAYLESLGNSDAYDFCCEWMGREWHVYQWFADAGDDDQECRGTLAECVTWLKAYIEKRKQHRLSPVEDDQPPTKSESGNG